jgi:hypothetical protein
MDEPSPCDSLPTRKELPATERLTCLAPSLSDCTFAALLAAGDRRETGPWQPPSPEALQPSFPQFEIIALLGHGGMGAVYKGWQRSLERVVAIKILPLALEDSDLDFAARFEREAKSMARLKHPNIVPVHDAGQTPDGLLYFVMDFVDGIDLQKTLAARRLLPMEALEIASQICDALAYAHRHGVIHRDIKPPNIMIDDESRVHLADFGIARSSSADGTTLTRPNLVMGTPDFIAPEAHLGMNQVDHRADLYAVGVVLYLMLTGHVPRGRFQPPSLRVPGLDPRVDAVVDRALQAEPERRYPSAMEMREALERLQVASPEAQASPMAPGRRGPSFGPRRWIALAAALFLLATGAVLFERRAHPSAAVAAPIKLWDDPASLAPSPGVQWENGAIRLDQAVVRSRERLARDVVFRAQIKMNQDAVSPQIAVRWQGRPEEENERRYLLGFARLSVDMVELAVCHDGQFQVLADWPLPRAYGEDEWATLELRAIGDELTASLDGQVLGVVRDGSIREPGGVGLSASAAGCFRKVTYLPLALPGGSVAATPRPPVTGPTRPGVDP